MIEDKEDCKLPFKDHVVILEESWNDHDYFSFKTQRIINSRDCDALQGEVRKIRLEHTSLKTNLSRNQATKSQLMRPKNNCRRVFFLAETTTRTAKLDRRREKQMLLQLPR